PRPPCPAWWRVNPHDGAALAQLLRHETPNMARRRCDTDAVCCGVRRASLCARLHDVLSRLRSLADDAGAASLARTRRRVRPVRRSLRTRLRCGASVRLEPTLQVTGGAAS